MIEGLIAILTSGAGGGIFGGLLGVFKGWMDGRERARVAQIELERDKLEYEAQVAERNWRLQMAAQGAQAELERVATEADAAAEVANQGALRVAQGAEFGSLRTTTGMDNYRASVRPTLAYWFSAIFTALLMWAFAQFHARITGGEGLELLMLLIGSLVFTVNSLVQFYFVSRGNRRST